MRFDVLLQMGLAFSVPAILYTGTRLSLKCIFHVLCTTALPDLFFGTPSAAKFDC